jgi:hypothetical protein
MAENKNINSQLEQLDGGEPVNDSDVPAYAPIYQVYPNSRIAVSNKMGPFWERRQKEGLAFLKNTNAQDRWEEAIRYYQNDQGGQSGRKGNLSEVGTGRSNEKKYATENIVFANISALVPAVYAKNPDIEITPNDEEQEAKAAMHEALLDTLFTRKSSPGINLKPKMRRATIMAFLTNLSYLELSYIKKDDSSEAVVTEVEALSQQLQEATEIKQIQEIEGKLQALDEKVNLLSSSGPRLRVRPPQAVIIDPNSEEVDLSDANYVIIEDYLRTEFLRAVYGTKDKETGEWKSLYDPTHVIKVGTSSADMQGHDDEINNFTILDSNADYTKYGYQSREGYENASRTRVWMVWDKSTRRVYMFHDKNWSQPIWVWDDPYKLTRFFPIFALSFYTDPIQRFARSEVMYYLDQQDEINTINNERARMRHWIMSKVFVNTNVIKDVTVIQNFLSGKTDHTVQGISLPEGVKIGDAISTLPAPSTQFEGLFDTGPIMQSVNRISSVTPVLQNEQYKTNTTNKAIESYESSTQTRLDEKVDAIEEVLGDIGNALSEMCIQFMPEDEVIKLVGKKLVDKAQGWDNDMTPQQFSEAYNFRIIGGSTLKPTSKVKKEQAIQLGQVLGQFAAASPPIVLIMLKAVERAFNEDVVITKDEWDMLIKSVQQSITSQPAPSANGGGAPTQGGQAPAGQPQQADPMIAALEQLSQIIDTLDPKLKAEVGSAIAKGVPLKQIVSSLAQQNEQPQQ